MHWLQIHHVFDLENNKVQDWSNEKVENKWIGSFPSIIKNLHQLHFIFPWSLITAVIVSQICIVLEHAQSRLWILSVVPTAFLLKIIKFFPSTFDLQAYPPSPWSKDTTIGMFLVRLLQKPFFFLPFKEELISHFDFKFSTLNKLDS